MVQDKLMHTTWQSKESHKLGESIPFPQGQEYLQYKTKTEQRLQSRSKRLSQVNGFNPKETYDAQVSIKTSKAANQELVEGFDGMIGPSAATKKTEKEIRELRKNEKQFNSKLSAYAMAHKHLMDTTQTFVSVTGTQKTGHSYGNQNVQVTDTDGSIHKGYVSSRGFFKPYESDDVFNNTAGKNGCGSTTTVAVPGTYPIQELSDGDVIESKPELFYLKNSPMISGQGCGDEASNIQVTASLLGDIKYSAVSYPNCFLTTNMIIQNDLVGDLATLENTSVRAADLGAPYFGVTTANDTPQGYISYSLPSTGDLSINSTVKIYSFPTHSYDEKDRDHIGCGLLYDGRLGMGWWEQGEGKWKTNKGVAMKKFTLDGSTDTPWNTTINGQPFTCDYKSGGNLNTIKATYGNTSKSDAKANCPDAPSNTSSLKTVSSGNWTDCVTDYRENQVDLNADGTYSNEFTFHLTDNVTATPETNKCYSNPQITDMSINSYGFISVPHNSSESTGLGFDRNTYCQNPFFATYNCGNQSYTAVYNPTPVEGSVAFSPDTADFTCTEQANLCNGRLTLNDDGSIVITDGTGKTTWSYPAVPESTSNIRYADPNWSMVNGQTGTNYLRAGIDMLKKKQWIGSPKGKFYLIMETNNTDNKTSINDVGDSIVAGADDVASGASVDSVAGDVANIADSAFSMVSGMFTSNTSELGLVLYENLLKCKKTDQGIVSEDADTIVVYKVNDIPDTGSGKPWTAIDNLNKVGLIGDDTKIHSYPDNLIKPGNTFYSMGNYDNTGNDIQMITGDLSACQQACLDNDNCAGFVRNNVTDISNCFLKNSKMFPNSIRTPNNNLELYIRSKSVSNNVSCPKEIDQSSALQWELYPVGDKMNMDTLCELGLASKTQRDELDAANKELMKMKDGITSKINTLTKEDAKLTKSLTNNIDKLDNDISTYKKTKKNMVQLKEKNDNLSGMKQESELNMVSQNTNYMIWSILAIIVVVGGIRATRL